MSETPNTPSGGPVSADSTGPVRAQVAPARRISAIWLIPLVALVIGGWTLAQTLLSQGPDVRITFATAEGLVAGETKVKTLDVEVGRVTEVELAEDFGSVTAIVRMAPQATELLREDTQFWVVRPRVGSSGISGLSTIMSGAHIQLTPGTGAPGWRRYRGLDDMPLTPPSTPGLQLQLLASGTSSINPGSPLLYNGYRVGRVENVVLDALNGQTRYTAFVERPYDDLVTSTTRFWNASGLSMDVGVNGFSVRTESLEAIISGGVAFGIPDGLGRGHAVDDGALYTLYDDIAELTENPHQHSTEYMLLFDSSIRGLAEGAPVDYRGMRVGTVLSVGVKSADWQELWSSTDRHDIPVLIRIEPGWFGDDSETAAREFADSLNAAVDTGLRASLAIGNLLTGGLYVSLDFAPGAPVASITRRHGLPVLPTVASGLEQIEDKVASFLSKLQQLPLDETVAAANSMLQQIETTFGRSQDTLAAINQVLGADGVNQLPASLIGTLQDTRSVLQGFDAESPVQQELITALRRLNNVLNGAGSVLQTYEQKPNALVFPSRRGRDPQPGGGNDQR